MTDHNTVARRHLRATTAALGLTRPYVYRDEHGRWVAVTRHTGQAGRRYGTQGKALEVAAKHCPGNLAQHHRRRPRAGTYRPDPPRWWVEDPADGRLTAPWPSPYAVEEAPA